MQTKPFLILIGSFLFSMSCFADNIAFCQLGANGITVSLEKSKETKNLFVGEIANYKVKVMDVNPIKIPIEIFDAKNNVSYSTEMALTGNKAVFVISNGRSELGLADSLAPNDGLAVLCQMK